MIFISLPNPDSGFWHNFLYSLPTWVPTAIIAAFALWISNKFSKSKDKLDKANYNKDLFDKRYEIFLVVKNLIIRIVKNDPHEPIEQKKLSVNEWEVLTYDSYFLFGESTYNFLGEVRLNAISWYNGQSLEELDRVYEIQLQMKASSTVEGSIKQKQNARKFFEDLYDHRKFLTKFPELKLDCYPSLNETKN